MFDWIGKMIVKFSGMETAFSESLDRSMPRIIEINKRQAKSKEEMKILKANLKKSGEALEENNRQRTAGTYVPTNIFSDEEITEMCRQQQQTDFPELTVEEVEKYMREANRWLNNPPEETA